MVDYSCKHYQIKCAKNEDACKEYTEQAKSYADSLHPETFVKTTGNQTIDGTKTFTSFPQVKNVVGKNSQIHLSDTTANSEIDIMQATSNGKNQFLVRFANGNKYPFIISQDTSNNANFIYELLSSPAASDNSNKIATTAWVNNKKADIVGWGIPDYTAGISVARATILAGYKAPCKGVLMGYYNPTSGTIRWTINDITVGGADNYIQSAFFPLNTNDVIKIAGLDSDKNELYFFPLKGVK